MLVLNHVRISQNTSKMKIKTYDKFWTSKLSKKISKNLVGDIIYSANTISHIHDLNQTAAIEYLLNDNGIFILEDHLSQNVKFYIMSFYDERTYVFNNHSEKNCKKAKIFNVEN